MNFIWVSYNSHVKFPCGSHVFHMNFRRISYEFRMIYMWNPHAFPWISYEFRVIYMWNSHAFPMYFIWISYEFHMNFQWFTCEIPIDFPCISYGFPIHFLHFPMNFVAHPIPSPAQRSQRELNRGAGLSSRLPNHWARRLCEKRP